MTKERLLSFAEYAKDAQPEVLVTLIQTIVERIYIVDKDDERFCHIFIKGCTDEDYTGFFQTAGYIEQKTTPVCDSEQCCICAEISEADNIREDKSGCRENIKRAEWAERSGDTGGRVLPRPYPHAGINTAAYECGTVYGIPEKQEQSDDIWPARKSEVQIWEPAFLVQRILCGYGGKVWRSDKGIYLQPITGRHSKWPDKSERVHRPVYGWAGETRQIKTAPEKGAASDKTVIARLFSAPFREPPQEIGPYRVCSKIKTTGSTGGFDFLLHSIPTINIMPANAYHKKALLSRYI